MAPAPIQADVTTVQSNNYVFFVVVTAVVYDYIITFSEESEYIWNKPWTWISTLFILSRYFGLCAAMSHSIWGTSFFPGTAYTYVTLFHHEISRKPTALDRCNIIFFLGMWSFFIFMCAADLVMVLRVWALYSRSRLILGILLTVYLAEVISFLVSYVLYSARFSNNPIAGTAQVLHMSYCVFEGFPLLDVGVLDVVQIALGTLMCLLTAIRFIKESLQMYNVTKRFRLSRYMKLLVWEGTVYFIVILLFSLINLLGNVLPMNSWQLTLGSSVQQILPFTLLPRFVLSLRGLYARDVQGRQGSEMETGFVIQSGSGRGATVSTVIFADIGRSEAEEQGNLELQAEEI